MAHSLLYLFVFVATFLRTAQAWGAAGHELVATIAQVYLHPSVLPTICALLDVDVDESDSESTLRSKCHLATIATWADKERMKMRWSAAMHYVGAVGDHPKDTCIFPGTEGWAGTKQINVLDAIKNVTHILGEWSGVSEEAFIENEGTPSRVWNKELLCTSPTLPLPPPSARHEEAFKFLVHFLGDMHQPLHLTGRDRGGNGDKVRWGHRETNLHSAWDTLIPAKLIRTVSRNYSRPLPDSRSAGFGFKSLFSSTPRSDLSKVSSQTLGPSSAQIESALRGTIYDPLVRRIIWEGVWDRWGNEAPDWSSCPVPEPEPETPDAESDLKANTILSPLQQIVKNVLPIHLFSELLSGSFLKEKVEILPDGPVVCPYAWAKPIHALNCKYIWLEEDQLVVEEEGDDWDHDHEDFIPSSVYGSGDSLSGRPPRHPPSHPPSEHPDLDTLNYMGPIERNMVVEKLFAQGGIRLATILNWLFAAEDQ